ncbi:hypothetical protein GUITHDRAFT_101387 [Guillardia theta CCMP2712]|uniref:Uncharacterized protein n=1 Tax=Guillardia theta (strain CCMP2712) TaxID=905079 RepID=L1JXJ4_GUITC|nr:hypothetical protein GUITHDRAFT_101387 [Guillardia theta CCMP2712]EKX52935.1 hypothetical protein GUITHDRAFT_101387 [Guillardia theta CCMP2712]|eukprot:XP_005839915.1 hypothetical protein GUITHDRAFT_101387 [Guillardia theta CCMP2712]
MKQTWWFIAGMSPRVQLEMMVKTAFLLSFFPKGGRIASSVVHPSAQDLVQHEMLRSCGARGPCIRALRGGSLSGSFEEGMFATTEPEERSKSVSEEANVRGLLKRDNPSKLRIYSGPSRAKERRESSKIWQQDYNKKDRVMLCKLFDAAHCDEGVTLEEGGTMLTSSEGRPSCCALSHLISVKNESLYYLEAEFKSEQPLAVLSSNMSEDIYKFGMNMERMDDHDHAGSVLGVILEESSDLLSHSLSPNNSITWHQFGYLSMNPLSHKTELKKCEGMFGSLRRDGYMFHSGDRVGLLVDTHRMKVSLEQIGFTRNGRLVQNLTRSLRDVLPKHDLRMFVGCHDSQVSWKVVPDETAIKTLKAIDWKDWVADLHPNDPYTVSKMFHAAEYLLTPEVYEEFHDIMLDPQWPKLGYRFDQNPEFREMVERMMGRKVREEELYSGEEEYRPEWGQETQEDSD